MQAWKVVIYEMGNKTSSADQDNWVMQYKFVYVWLPRARNLAWLFSNHLHLHTFYLCTLNANNRVLTKKLFNLFQHLKSSSYCFQSFLLCCRFQLNSKNKNNNSNNKYRCFNKTLWNERKEIHEMRHINNFRNAKYHFSKMWNEMWVYYKKIEVKFVST
jgi:hypothetical protein